MFIWNVPVQEIIETAKYYADIYSTKHRDPQNTVTVPKYTHTLESVILRPVAKHFAHSCSLRLRRFCHWEKESALSQRHFLRASRLTDLIFWDCCTWTRLSLEKWTASFYHIIYYYNQTNNVFLWIKCVCFLSLNDINVKIMLITHKEICVCLCMYTKSNNSLLNITTWSLMHLSYISSTDSYLKSAASVLQLKWAIISKHGQPLKD